MENDKTSNSFVKKLVEIIPWVPFLLIPLAILAVIILLLFSHYLEYPLRTDAQSMMTEILKALDFYKMDNGRYPLTSEGLRALLKPKQGSEDSYIKEIPKDPWGNSFHYESDGKECKIVSYGSDGKQGGTGTREDIVVGTRKRKD